MQYTEIHSELLHRFFSKIMNWKLTKLNIKTDDKKTNLNKENAFKQT